MLAIGPVCGCTTLVQIISPLLQYVHTVYSNGGEREGEREGGRKGKGGKEREERGREERGGRERRKEREERRGRKERGRRDDIYFFVMCHSNHLTDVHLDLLFLLLNFHLQLLNIFTKFANL